VTLFTIAKRGVEGGGAPGLQTIKVFEGEHRGNEKVGKPYGRAGLSQANWSCVKKGKGYEIDAKEGGASLAMAGWFGKCVRGTGGAGGGYTGEKKLGMKEMLTT